MVLLLLQSGTSSSSTDRAAQSGLSFQVGESTSDIIETKTIQANTSGFALSSLVSQASAGAAVSAAATAGTTGVFTRTMASAAQTAVDKSYHYP